MLEDPEANEAEQLEHTFFCFGNLCKLLFLAFFTIVVLYFPLEELKEWASEKKWLRKLFRLAPPTHKYIKNS